MSSAAEEARVALFQASHGTFVAERKRLVGELKAQDKAAATALSKQARPSVPAWAVNQLWWKARGGFEALLSAVGRVKKGELAAMAEQREAMQSLLKRATELLKEDGNAAADATVRKVEFTLSNVAMNGFAPDAPGMLVEERDPPGFDALAGFVAAAASAAPVLKLVPKPEPEASEVDEAALAAQREEEERQKREALKRAHAEADREIEVTEAALEKAEQEVARIEATLEVAKTTVEMATRRRDAAVKKKEALA
ncbi:MAG: hypothetical protein ACO1OB_05685 [Archangium sp.]